MTTPAASMIWAGANLSTAAYAADTVPPDRLYQTIETALGAIPASAMGPWTLQWGPVDNDGILAYVAISDDGSTYALAFRGSLTEDDAEGFVENWLADLDAIEFLPWMYPANGGNVTDGMNDAFALAVAGCDPQRGLTLVDYFRELAQHAGSVPLIVTGHSLGGALANLFAGYLHDQIPKFGAAVPQMTPVTFAAPTVSDAIFKAWWDGLFAAGAYHAVNAWDIVPAAWGDLKAVLALYPPPVGSFQDWAGTVAADALEAWADLRGWLFGILGGTIDANVTPAPEGADWPSTAMAQHSMANVYLPYIAATYGSLTSKAAG